MKIIQVNSVCGVGSTGRICTGIAEIAKQNGHECKIAYGRMQAPKQYDDISYRIESDFGVKIHALESRLFGKTGTYSKQATKRFLDWLDIEKPDILHLHNLHGYYINYPMLFDYIKTNNIRIVWTLHDCWAFTGHCAYFDMVGCNKWETHCSKCVQKSAYPKSFADTTEKMFDLKTECFTGVRDMTIVTPSQWLADLVKRSYLRNYDVKVIHNGIDLDIFKPTESDFRSKYVLFDKKIILGVAFQWEERKGLDVFVEFAKRLSDDYQIVLVGTNERVQKTLPKNIITISRTNSQMELAQIYTAADVFVNPTRQENFPTVNLEALACGTPVVTFDTGGSPETIDKSSGVVVAKNDISAMESAIRAVCEECLFTESVCVKRATQFDAASQFQKYVELYVK